MTDWLLGVDVGASGSRLALTPLGIGGPQWDAVRQLTGERLTVGPGGSSGAEVMLALVRRARSTWDDIETSGIRGAAAGIAGFETVVADPDTVPARLRELLPSATVAICGDMVTAHLGALGTGGAVLAAGTGAIALGTDLDRIWQRVDGWGHLIGDLGSGAWIGMQGLRLAAAAADGRDPRGAALRPLIEGRLGPVADWPAAIYRRTDRAGVLAEFARDVEVCAAAGDPGSFSILETAAHHLADTLLAALAEGVPRVAAIVGGLVSADAGLRELVVGELAHRVPDLELRDPLGTPLDGAVRLAALAAADQLPQSGPLRV